MQENNSQTFDPHSPHCSKWVRKPLNCTPTIDGGSNRECKAFHQYPFTKLEEAKCSGVRNALIAVSSYDLKAVKHPRQEKESPF
ncbi:hypothetical protein TNCV_1211041 [Trichonephila clavipes]|nr:hypothetical protein TNCV_1211041 [Trichonephila clavipes]